MEHVAARTAESAARDVQARHRMRVGKLRRTSVQDRLPKVFEDSDINITVYWLKTELDANRGIQTYAVNVLRSREVDW